MTDFTTDLLPEADGPRLRAAPPRREYLAYFGLIFLATLPLTTLTWTLTAARRLELPEKGPVARAWSQARIITPHIFQG